jgi:hypothetical protein
VLARTINLLNLSFHVVEVAGSLRVDERRTDAH